MKCLVTAEPVMRALVYDGHPFRVISDGCKMRYGAVLEQEFKYTVDSGATVHRWHPIAFASKHTSATEEKYISFLSEFAVLKFVLDDFNPYIFGVAIEVKTDCQALRDLLLRDNLGATHARWRDAILAHHIVDVRHRPGNKNQVADTLSCKWDGEGHTANPTDRGGWTVTPD